MWKQFLLSMPAPIKSGTFLDFERATSKKLTVSTRAGGQGEWRKGILPLREILTSSYVAFLPMPPLGKGGHDPGELFIAVFWALLVANPSMRPWMSHWLGWAVLNEKHQM